MPGSIYNGSTSITVKGVIGSFYARLQDALKGTFHPKISNIFTSDQLTENYPLLGASPALREWTGMRNEKNVLESKISLTNKTYEATLACGVDDRRRDKTGQLMIRVNDLALRAADHIDSLVSTLILNGTGSTSGLAYDGQYFFDNDHSLGASGTLVNAITYSQVSSLNVTTATAPTITEMEKVILDCIAYMMLYTDEQGQYMNGNAKGWVLMCAPNPIFSAALAATKANQLTSGQSNTLMQTGWDIEVIANPRLAATTSGFYLFRKDAASKPFIVQVEQDYIMDAIVAGSEYSKLNNKELYGVKWTGTAGYGEWRYGAYCAFH